MVVTTTIQRARRMMRRREAKNRIEKAMQKKIDDDRNNNNDSESDNDNDGDNINYENASNISANSNSNNNSSTNSDEITSHQALVDTEADADADADTDTTTSEAEKSIPLVTDDSNEPVDADDADDADADDDADDDADADVDENDVADTNHVADENDETTNDLVDIDNDENDVNPKANKSQSSSSSNTSTTSTTSTSKTASVDDNKASYTITYSISSASISTPTPSSTPLPSSKLSSTSISTSFIYFEKSSYSGYTNWKTKLLTALLKQVRTKVDQCKIFTKPIDPIEDDCPDYYDIIDKKHEAMSFDTMEKLVQEDELVDIDDFEICLNRIRKCAIKYYKEGQSSPTKLSSSRPLGSLSRPLQLESSLSRPLPSSSSSSSLLSIQNDDNFIIRQANLINIRAAPIIEEATILWNQLAADDIEYEAYHSCDTTSHSIDLNVGKNVGNNVNKSVGKNVDKNIGNNVDKNNGNKKQEITVIDKSDENDNSNVKSNAKSNVKSNRNHDDDDDDGSNNVTIDVTNNNEKESNNRSIRNIRRSTRNKSQNNKIADDEKDNAETQPITTPPPPPPPIRKSSRKRRTSPNKLVIDDSDDDNVDVVNMRESSNDADENNSVTTDMSNHDRTSNQRSMRTRRRSNRNKSQNDDIVDDEKSEEDDATSSSSSSSVSVSVSLPTKTQIRKSSRKRRTSPNKLVIDDTDDDSNHVATDVSNNNEKSNQRSMRNRRRSNRNKSQNSEIVNVKESSEEKEDDATSLLPSASTIGSSRKRRISPNKLVINDSDDDSNHVAIDVSNNDEESNQQSIRNRRRSNRNKSQNDEIVDDEQSNEDKEDDTTSPPPAKMSIATTPIAANPAVTTTSTPTRKSSRKRRISPNKLMYNNDEDYEQNERQKRRNTKNDSKAGFQQILKQLVQKIQMRVDNYGFFTEPVDPIKDECPDYYDIIDKENEAMSFSVMEQLVDEGKIVDIPGVEMYLQRIIKSAQKYNNDEDNFIRQQADFIENKSLPFIKMAMQKWETMERKTKDKEKQEKDRKKAVVHPRKSNTLFSDTSDDDYNDDGYGTSGESSYRDDASARLRSSRSLRQRQTQQKKRQTRSSREKKRVVYSEGTNENTAESSSDESMEDEDKNIVIEGSDIPFCRRDLSSSIMSHCTDRSEWKKLCPKLAIVCNEAARRGTLRVNPDAKRYEKPLSEIYIEERLDYDTPLNGFIVKTKQAPYHLQGFIITTNFVTWRRTFRWTTETPASLITPTDHRLHATDIDGLLAKDLQNVKREGSDSTYGYTFDRVGEISLLGGLGCGGALVARALSELRQSGEYDYVVLQATKVAIPFYEKHGFVRVGAVTRFNDNEALPEVAYRHWSEIVSGEAVEPSYMMARRLQGSKVDHKQVQKKLTMERREYEIRSALKSVHSLLSDALSIRAGKSSVYVNSYREMLSAAKEFALSANDDSLVQVIDRASAEYTGSAIRASKSIIRHELKLPKTNKEKDEVSSQGKDYLVDLDIDVICDSKSVDGPRPLTASLLKSFFSTNPFYSMEVLLSGPQYRQEEPLFANIRVSASNCNKEMVDAINMAVCNLKTFLCSVPNRRKTTLKNSKKKSQQLVKKGQTIMLRVDGYKGMPLWVQGEVEKCHQKRSCGKDNMCIVNWENEITKRTVQETRLLDTTNRGVGREWCSDLDWSSFSLLPPSILDGLLIGSTVQYTNVKGKNINGTLTKRIGGGMNGEPKWRLSSWKKGRKNVIPDLSALELREVVTINDETIARASIIVNQFSLGKASPPKNDPDEAKQESDNESHSEPIKAHKSEQWASFRLRKFELDSKGAKDEKRRNTCEELDDNIIHLSTGVSSKTQASLSSRRQKSDISDTSTGTCASENKSTRLKVLSEDAPVITKKKIDQEIKTKDHESNIASARLEVSSEDAPLIPKKVIKMKDLESKIISASLEESSEEPLVMTKKVIKTKDPASSIESVSLEVSSEDPLVMKRKEIKTREPESKVESVSLEVSSEVPPVVERREIMTKEPASVSLEILSSEDPPEVAEKKIMTREPESKVQPASLAISSEDSPVTSEKEAKTKEPKSTSLILQSTPNLKSKMSSQDESQSSSEKRRRRRPRTRSRDILDSPSSPKISPINKKKKLNTPNELRDIDVTNIQPPPNKGIKRRSPRTPRTCEYVKKTPHSNTRAPMSTRSQEKRSHGTNRPKDLEPSSVSSHRAKRIFISRTNHSDNRKPRRSRRNLIIVGSSLGMEHSPTTKRRRTHL